MSVRWDAAEAITWIAFRNAKPLQRWGEFPAWQWSRPWGFIPPNELLPALRARAERRLWKPEIEPVFMARRYRARARRLVRDTGEDATSLVGLLETDIERFNAYEVALVVAEAELTAAARDGQIEVWAHPCDGRGLHIGDGGMVLVPPYAFYSPMQPRTISRLSKVDLPSPTPLIDILQPNGLFYNGVTFDADQIQRKWKPVAPNTQEIYDWMLKESTEYLARYGSKAKRDDMISRCVASLDCRFEDAEAVHKKLPLEYRRQRGERKV